MRQQDKRIFLQAAKELNVWILVRRTNPASLQYIGRAGYTPKRIDCKAKTARFNVQPYQLAGLVVSPHLHPKAFDPNANPAVLNEVNKYWAKMEPLPGTQYQVEDNPRSQHYGCLKFQGAFIHGDYDLYDVIDVDQPFRNLALVETLHGQPHRRGAKFLAVQKFVNDRIGSPMVQHGGEAQFADHSEQSIDAFGPNGEDTTILNEFSVRAWYETRFGGRKTLS